MSTAISSAVKSITPPGLRFNAASASGISCSTSSPTASTIWPGTFAGNCPRAMRAMFRAICAVAFARSRAISAVCRPSASLDRAKAASAFSCTASSFSAALSKDAAAASSFVAVPSDNSAAALPRAVAASWIVPFASAPASSPSFLMRGKSDFTNSRAASARCTGKSDGNSPLACAANNRARRPALTALSRAAAAALTMSGCLAFAAASAASIAALAASSN